MAINITKPTPLSASPYTKIKRSDLFQKLEELLKLTEELQVRQLIVDSEGSVFLYYKDTDYGPVQVIGE